MALAPMVFFQKQLSHKFTKTPIFFVAGVEFCPPPRPAPWKILYPPLKFGSINYSCLCPPERGQLL